MTEKENELLKYLSNKILNLSCDFAEIRISTGIATVIALSGDDIDVISSGDFTGGSIRVLDRGRWGFVSFNDTGSIPTDIERALELARKTEERQDCGVCSIAPVILNHTIKTKKNLSSIHVAEKFKLLDSYNRILKNASHIQTTRSMYRDTLSNTRYFNTEGTTVEYEKSFCGISLTAVAKDGSIVQPYSDSIAGYGGYEMVENQESRAEKVVKTAVDLLKAVPVSGGNYGIIIDPRLAGVFIHEAFGHLSEADFVYENETMKKLMMLGKRIGPAELNVIDDGTVSGLPGFVPIDDEGIPSQKTHLIKNGQLAGRLHSRETAFRMKESPTGNARAISVMHQPIVRMTNTYIDNGTRSFEELLDSLGDGLYVCDAQGGQTNLEMFTFSAGYAREIRKGKIGRLVKDVMLSGNVFKTLDSIESIADDLQMFGGLGGCGKRGQSPLPVSFGGPHLLVRDVLIGGSGQ